MSGIFAIFTSYMTTAYGVFLASSGMFICYGIFYLNKYSFYRENLNERLETIMPSSISFIYGLGTIAFSIWDYYTGDFRLGFRYFYVLFTLIIYLY